MFGGTWSRTAIQTTQLSIFLPKWTTIRGLEGPGFGLCPCFCEWNVSTGPSLPLHPERPDGFVQERGIAAYWTSTCQCKWVYWWHWWSTLSFWSTATPKKREKQNPAYRILYSRLVANYMSIFLEFVWVQLPRRNGAFNESSICRTGGRLSQWWKMSLFTGLLQPTIVGRGKWAILPLYIYIYPLYPSLYLGCWEPCVIPMLRMGSLAAARAVERFRDKEKEVELGLGWGRGSHGHRRPSRLTKLLAAALL